MPELHGISLRVGQDEFEEFEEPDWAWSSAYGAIEFQIKYVKVEQHKMIPLELNSMVKVYIFIYAYATSYASCFSRHVQLAT